MERQYEPIYDNGLFVIADALGVNYQDLTKEYIIEKQEILVDYIIKAYRSSTIKSCMSKLNYNSQITQLANKTKPKIKGGKEKIPIPEDEKNKLLLDFMKKHIFVIPNHISNTQCKFCGDNRILSHLSNKEKITDKVYRENKANKSYYYKLASTQTTNTLNMFQYIDICPCCLGVILMGSLNATYTSQRIGKDKIDTFATIITSDDDEYMKELTSMNKERNFQWINSEIDKEKSVVTSKTKLIEDFLYEHDFCEGYLQMDFISNPSQPKDTNPVINESLVFNKKDLKYLTEIKNLSLLDEFKHMNALKYLKDFKKNWINYFVDITNNVVKNDNRELFNVTEEFYSRMSKDLIHMIEEKCQYLKEHNFKKPKELLKQIKNYNEYQQLLLTWLEKDRNVFTKEEFNQLNNIKLYKDIKNRMIAEFIFNN